jgi:hypothetical protein
MAATRAGRICTVRMATLSDDAPARGIVQLPAGRVTSSTLRFGEPVPGYAMVLGHVFVA